jgi:hypothetical protein
MTTISAHQLYRATLFKQAAGLSAVSGDPRVVADFDVKTLIESIRQFPDLAHQEEPGFANTYANPQFKNLLWRSAALLPLGLAAGGLATLGLTDARPKPPTAKKKNAKPAVKKADADSAFQSIREQLPGLHPVDTAVGALGGAALGGLYDVIRGNSARLPANKRWRSTAQRVLTGALLGGAGVNLAGDRARRYVSNTLLPFGYDNSRLKNVAITPKQLGDDLSARFKNWRSGKTTLTGAPVNNNAAPEPDSLSKIWRAAILDERQYDPKDLAEISSFGNHGGTIDSRREIMRRSFGVHANNPATDWWQKNQRGYYSLNEKSPEYLQRLRLIFGPEKPYGSSYAMETLLRDPQKKLTAFNTAGPKNLTPAAAIDFFAGGQVSGDQQVPFALRGRRIDAQALDRFDLTPGKDEQRHLLSWVRNKMTGRDPMWLDKQPGDDAGDFHYKDTGKTNEQIAKTIGARWLWENVLSSELPWISQKMTFLPNPPEDKAKPADPDHLPWALQFLRESGEAAGPKLNTIERVNNWVDDNPLAKDHELLIQIRELAKQKAEAEKNSAAEKRAADNTDLKNLLSGAGRGALAGTALGGIHGLFAPGEEDEYDDEGNVIGKQRRSRLAAAIRGALGGAVLGGSAGAALNYMKPGLVGDIHNFARRGLTGKNQAQLNTADNVGRMTYKQRRKHDLFLRGQQWAKNQPVTQPHPPIMMLDPEPWESGQQMPADEIARSESALVPEGPITWPHVPNMGADSAGPEP